MSKQIVALWLSRVFHPSLLTVIALFGATYLAGSPLMESLLWAVLYLAIVLAPPMILLLLGVRSGQYSDRNASLRGERPGLFAVGSVGIVLFLIVLNAANAPRPVLATMWSIAFAIAAAAVINQVFTKVSLHALGTAGSAAVIGSVSLPAGIVVGVAALSVSWSRVELRQHSLGQVALGWVIAFASVIPIFHFLLP